MKDQHKHIKGYRDLSEDEVKLVNELKEKGAEIGELLEKIINIRDQQCIVDDLTGDDILESYRCLDTAKDNIQTGMMWAIRSVTLPQSFC